MVVKLLCAVAFLFFAPAVVGHGVNRLLKINPSIVKNYLVGNIFIWALFQIVSVPLILEKQRFSTVVILISVIVIGVMVWAIIYETIIKKGDIFRQSPWKNQIGNIKIADVLAVLFMVAIMGWLFYKIVSLQHTDADDARFIVNAVEMLRTDRMFLTDVITGEELKIWVGELSKDVTSPWAVYIAYCAKITGISVVTMAHSVLSVALILCGISVFWLFSKVIFKDNIKDRCLFVSLVLLMNIYGFHSVYTAETFFLTRIWQGKAAVAAIAIPAIFLIFMRIYENEKKYGYFVLLAFMNIGMCLMSGTGIIIGAVMLLSTGIIYGIRKRNIWVTLLLWEMCAPNAIYFLINELQPEVWTL